MPPQTLSLSSVFICELGPVKGFLSTWLLSQASDIGIFTKYIWIRFWQFSEFRFKELSNIKSFRLVFRKKEAFPLPSKKIKWFFPFLYGCLWKSRPLSSRDRDEESFKVPCTWRKPSAAMWSSAPSQRQGSQPL